MSEIPFSKGDRVEIRRASSLSPPWPGADSFCPATVLRAPARSRSQILVEYETIVSPSSPLSPLREYVPSTAARPAPPRELGRRFVEGEAVEVFVEDAWRPGKVVAVSGGCLRYLAFMEGTEEEAEFSQKYLRLRREWTDHGWNPPFPGQKIAPKRKSLCRESKPGKAMQLKITFKEEPEPLFKKGATVEVRSDEKGYEGAWYTANVIGYLGNGKYLVEYVTLQTDDETAALREEACAEDLRPYPPRRVVPYRLLDKVDVWYNEGWWAGVISKVLKGSSFLVYFSTTNEEIVFDVSELRIHQNWMNRKWVVSTQLVPDTENIEQKIDTEYSGSSKTCLRNGMKVEVWSNEEGYQGSMFSAVILGSVGEDEYLVEYQTLKTDDGKEFFKEKVSGSKLRPHPPEVMKFCGFARLEAVDAWFNEGWWSGHISQILKDSKYVVYFRTTNEEMVFNHSDLRPHLEWIGGQWAPPPKDHISA